MKIVRNDREIAKSRGGGFEEVSNGNKIEVNRWIVRMEEDGLADRGVGGV